MSAVPFGNNATDAEHPLESVEKRMRDLAALANVAGPGINPGKPWPRSAPAPNWSPRDPRWAEQSDANAHKRGLAAVYMAGHGIGPGRISARTGEPWRYVPTWGKR